MMELRLQIITIIYSFIYGIFFAFMLNIFHKYVYSNKLLTKILFTFIFTITNSILYFLILNKINNGIIHYYSLIFIILGFSIENRLKSIIEKKFKK